MSKAVLLETLADEVKHNDYMDGLERYCEQRRQGKRLTSSGLVHTHTHTLQPTLIEAKVHVTLGIFLRLL